MTNLELLFFNYTQYLYCDYLVIRRSNNSSLNLIVIRRSKNLLFDLFVFRHSNKSLFINHGKF